MSQLRRDAALTPPRRRRIDSAVETQYLYAEGGPPSQGAREPSVNLRSRSAVGLGRMLLTPKRLYDDYRLSFK